MARAIKVPIVTAKDLIEVLSKLQSKAIGGVADLSIKVDGEPLIVHNVRWNGMGDEIEILTSKAD